MYAPIPVGSLVAVVTDGAYRSAYFRTHDGKHENVAFVGGQWHHVCMAFEVRLEGGGGHD